MLFVLYHFNVRRWDSDGHMCVTADTRNDILMYLEELNTDRSAYRQKILYILIPDGTQRIYNMELSPSAFYTALKAPLPLRAENI